MHGLYMLDFLFEFQLTEPFSGDEADQEADQESTGCSDYDLPNVKIGSGKQKNIMTKDNAGPGFQSNVTNGII